MNNLDRILNSKLCIGCGLCESMGKEKGYKVSIDSNGFYSVKVPKDRSWSTEEHMVALCPSVNIVGTGGKTVWGLNKGIYKSHSLDEEIRLKASSGGLITAACCYLLDSHKVDGILHVGKDANHYIHNSLTVSRTRDDVIRKASSRYAPAIIFSELVQIFEENNNSYAFVGKPCDVLGLKNFLKASPRYSARIAYFISIFCAGMPSYNATDKVIRSLSKTSVPAAVRYRGNGWPGTFTVVYKDGSSDSKTYSESWNKYLGKDLHYRCKVCPDSVGTLSDISVADAWNIRNGKPDFTEAGGESCVIVRTEIGLELMKELSQNSIISSEIISEDLLKMMQPNHVRKRTSSGYKLILFRFLKPGLFDIKREHLLCLMTRYNVLKGIRDMYGAWTRYKKWTKNK